VLLVSIAAVGLIIAGCGSSSSSTSSAAASTSRSVSSTTSGASAANGHVVLVSAFPLAGNPFYLALECTAKSEAAKLGVNLTVDNPAVADVQHELPILQAAIATHPKVIILSSIDRTALAATVHQATAQGIKFIYVDQLPNDLSGAVSVLKYNVHGLGVTDAQVLAQALGHKGQVIDVVGPPGIPTVQTVHQGFLDGLKGAGVTYKTTIYDPAYSASSAATQVSSALSGDPSIRGISAWINVMSDGVLTALRQSGQTGIKVISNYTGYEQLPELASGKFVALVGLPASQLGAESVQQADDVLAGKPTTARITLPTLTLTSSNMNSAAAKPYEYPTTCSR
jgi:ribose transport system substrate-binding protein